MKETYIFLFLGCLFQKAVRICYRSNSTFGFLSRWISVPQIQDRSPSPAYCQEGLANLAPCSHKSSWRKCLLKNKREHKWAWTSTAGEGRAPTSPHPPKKLLHGNSRGGFPCFKLGGRRWYRAALYPSAGNMKNSFTPPCQFQEKSGQFQQLFFPLPLAGFLSVPCGSSPNAKSHVQNTKPQDFNGRRLLDTTVQLQ